MDSKKPSGAEFKKRRIEKEAEAVRNTPKIQSYFTPKQGLYFSELAPKKKEIGITSLYVHFVRKMILQLLRKYHQQLIYQKKWKGIYRLKMKHQKKWKQMKVCWVQWR